ncbi:hypothetical protein D3C84_1200130 [compost metagenome]
MIFDSSRGSNSSLSLELVSVTWMGMMDRSLIITLSRVPNVSGDSERMRVL